MLIDDFGNVYFPTKEEAEEFAKKAGGTVFLAAHYPALYGVETK
jgi:hypothetical protein